MRKESPFSLRRKLNDPNGGCAPSWQLMSSFDQLSVELILLRCATLPNQCQTPKLLWSLETDQTLVVLAVLQFGSDPL